MNSDHEDASRNEEQVKQNKRGVCRNRRLCRKVEEHVESVYRHNRKSVEDASEFIWSHNRQLQQPSGKLRSKVEACEMIEEELKKLFPEKMVECFVSGSSVNGSASYRADLDICLLLSSRDNNSRLVVMSKKEIIRTLWKIKKSIWSPEHRPLRRVIGSAQVIPARVSILNGVLTKDYREIPFDISINSKSGVFNSYLIGAYARFDKRAAALSLFLKHWGLVKGVINPKEGGLSCYAMNLLVIHFLQCGVKPAILPNLQFLYKETFDPDQPARQYQKFNDVIDNLPEDETENSTSIGKLIIGFFYYFYKFDFDGYYISIRQGGAIEKTRVNDNHFDIREPFDDSRNVASRVSIVKYIREELRRASKTLGRKERFSLVDIGVEFNV